MITISALLSIGLYHYNKLLSLRAKDTLIEIDIRTEPAHLMIIMDSEVFLVAAELLQVSCLQDLLLGFYYH